MDTPNHTAEISRMEDTLFKAFPTVNRVGIEVKGDFGTEIILTLGDKELFNASEGEREQVALKASVITKHVFGEKIPGKGSIIFVQEENSINPEAEKKVYSMALEED